MYKQNICILIFKYRETTMKFGINNLKHESEGILGIPIATMLGIFHHSSS